MNILLNNPTDGGPFAPNAARPPIRNAVAQASIQNVPGSGTEVSKKSGADRCAGSEINVSRNVPFAL